MKIPKLSQLIASKKFDYVNSDITDNLFSKPSSISSDYRLYHFNRYISSEDAIKEMAKDGFCPANAWELIQWPDWNEKDLVVALGSVGEVVGGRGVPGLFGGDSERSLYLSCWVGDWLDYCRFLGVRNSEISTSEPQKSALGTLDTLTLPDRLIINGVTYVKE